MTIRIALAGNPNCGKTTMFNDLTGANQYVGNWPGVTVEKKEGKHTRDKDVLVTDLPGVYSLSPYSPEEIVTRDYLLGGEPDVVVNLVDATNLERNLYLTSQILDLGIPVVVALNMMDLVRKNGDKIDAAKLSQRLGCPVVETAALKGEGLDDLVRAAVEAAKAGAAPRPQLRFDAAVEDVVAQVEGILGARVKPAARRWFAVKLLEGEKRTIDALRLPQGSLEDIDALRVALEDKLDDDAESIVAGERYDAIAHVVDATVKRAPKGMTSTQKIDRVVTNRWLGLPIFVAVMTLVYYISVSTVGTLVTDWANDGLFGDGWLYGDTFVPGIPVVLGDFLASIGTADWLQALVLDGIVAGVGAVLGFVPQLIVLFLLLSVLEYCGYLARVAFIMDRVFRKFGLSGKSFIPMMIASGCGVPAVMATKAIESEKDRRMTVMTATMIPCGAKLPIIALVFGAIAGGDYEATWWVAPLFYFLGLAAIVASCIMLRKTRMFAGEATPFVMELPAYHLPRAKSVLMSAWERVRSYIVKAGTVIFLSSIAIWFLNNFGFYGGTFGMLDPEMEGFMDHSLMAGVGNALAWMFAPLGFGDWQSAVTSVTGLVAKENVVATVGVMTAVGEAGETDPALWAAFAAMLGGSIPAIMAFCAFNLLCAPCFAAIGAIRRQMMSAKWTWFAIGYLTAFAWAVGLMLYQFGGLVTGELSFSGWTVLAMAVAAGMLFQLLRPMPDYDARDRARALKAEANAA